MCRPADRLSQAFGSPSSPTRPDVRLVPRSPLQAGAGCLRLAACAGGPCRERPSPREGHPACRGTAPQTVLTPAGVRPHLLSPVAVLAAGGRRRGGPQGPASTPDLCGRRSLHRHGPVQGRRGAAGRRARGRGPQSQGGLRDRVPVGVILVSGSCAVAATCPRARGGLAHCLGRRVRSKPLCCVQLSFGIDPQLSPLPRRPGGCLPGGVLYPRPGPGPAPAPAQPALGNHSRLPVGFGNRITTAAAERGWRVANGCGEWLRRMTAADGCGQLRNTEPDISHIPHDQIPGGSSLRTPLLSEGSGLRPLHQPFHPTL